MAATSQDPKLFEDYEGFVEKFKPKKTTDDCYTSPAIYQVVLDYVVDRYGIDPEKVSRPFYPGGDYEAEDYDGMTVVDNPPFSILSRIVKFYVANDVPFFLFALSLTCLSSIKSAFPKCCAIVCDSNVTYENGADVQTGFVTNMETDGSVLVADPELGEAVNAKNAELRSQAIKHNPKYTFPDHVMTNAKAQWFAAHHMPYRLKTRDYAPIAKLDAMGDKGIFGGGLLLSERAAGAPATRGPFSATSGPQASPQPRSAATTATTANRRSPNPGPAACATARPPTQAAARGAFLVSSVPAELFRLFPNCVVSPGWRTVLRFLLFSAGSECFRRWKPNIKI